MAGFTDDVENALFLRNFDVPFWASAHIFGRVPMYRFRIEQSLGRNSLVGTTLKDPEPLPEHAGADEKHTRIKGVKAYAGEIA